MALLISSPAAPVSSVPTWPKSSSAAASACASSTAHHRQASNLAHLAGVEFVEGDLADLAVAKRAVAGMDYVLHQAAIPSVPRSVEDPITSNRANIDATLNVLVAARDAGVKRVVYAGSSSVYGDTPRCRSARTCRRSRCRPTRCRSWWAMAIQIRTSLAEPETAETFVPHKPARPDKAEGGKRSSWSRL